jgi:hypothetical protein
VRKVLSVRRALVILAVLGGLLTACESGAAAQPTPGAAPPAITPFESAAPSPTAGSPGPAVSTTVPPEAVPVVERAKQEAAARASVPVSQIQVISIARVAWPDSSLGCPQPGQMYSQIVTPGYKIILQAGNATVEYHTDLTQRVVACAASK